MAKPLLSFEGFSHSHSTTDFGEPIHHFDGPEGTGLHLTESGLELLDDQDFATLLGASLHMVTEEGGIHVATGDIVLDDPRGGDRTDKSQIFRRGEYTLKAGGNSAEADIQYGAMNLLHAAFKPETQVNAPAQYARISSPAGTPTVIMQHGNGEPLSAVAHTFRVSAAESDHAKATAEHTIHTAAIARLGSVATHVLLNDIGQQRHHTNILVEGDAFGPDATYTVLDQPYVGGKARPGKLLVLNALRKTYHKR